MKIAFHELCFPQRSFHDQLLHGTYVGPSNFASSFDFTSFIRDRLVYGCLSGWNVSQTQTNPGWLRGTGPMLPVP
jgi:hypothetical protein